jgi:hypothetical protein
MGNFAVIATNKGGRPSKYSPAAVRRLVSALKDGLTQKQACIAVGICENTLAAWQRKHSELEAEIGKARERARRMALAGIKAAAEKGDWRAWESFLRFSFHADYRQGANVSVTATATAQQAIVCDEATRARLIEQRERLQAKLNLANGKETSEGTEK